MAKKSGCPRCKSIWWGTVLNLKTGQSIRRQCADCEYTAADLRLIQGGLDNPTSQSHGSALVNWRPPSLTDLRLHVLGCLRRQQPYIELVPPPLP